MNLRATLGDVRPLVRDARPVAPLLSDAFDQLRPFARDARPVVAETRAVVDRAGTERDLLGVLEALVGLSREAVPAFDSTVKTVEDALPVVREVRPYVPDVIGGLINGFGGTTGGYYDANGHYVRISFQGSTATLTGLGSLVPRPPEQQGLTGFRTQRGQALPRRRRRSRPRTAPTRSSRSPPCATRRTRRDEARPARPRRSAWPRPSRRSGAGGTEPTYRVDAVFDSTANLIPGQDVKIAGARVGQVSDIELTKERKARVEMEIEEGFAPFRADAECTIRPQSLIGEKFVQCHPGTPDSPPLENGDGGAPTVPLEQTHAPVDLDLVFAALRRPYGAAARDHPQRAGHRAGGPRRGPERRDPAGEPGAAGDQRRPGHPRPRPRGARPAGRPVRPRDRASSLAAAAT